MLTSPYTLVYMLTSPSTFKYPSARHLIFSIKVGQTGPNGTDGGFFKAQI